MEVLEKANPNFYPVPTKQNKVAEGMYDTPRLESGYLTKKEFVRAYDQCSDLLHAKNPFSERSSNLETFLSETAPKCMDKIITLLNHHHVFPLGDI